MTEIAQTPEPDFEELAAYIDGQLSGTRKARVEERLLHDEDFYETFLETVRFQEAEAGGGEVIKPPVTRWRSWWVAIPLVAAAMLVIVVGLPRGAQSPGDWVGSVDAAAVVRVESWSDNEWDGLRGDEPSDRLTPEERAFRFGVRSADLRIAVAAGDRTAAGEIVEDLGELSETSDLLPMAHAYGQLQDGIDEGGPEAHREKVSTVEEYLVKIFESSLPETRLLLLGGWAETGRLAALAHDADGLVRLLRKDPGSESIAEIAPLMTSIRQALADGDPDAEDFAALATAFAGIVGQLSG